MKEPHIPCLAKIQILLDRSQLWLTEWQRSCWGAIPVELAGNLSSRVLRKPIHGEVSYGKHSNMKSLKEALAAIYCRSQTLVLLVLQAAEVLCYKPTWWLEVREVQGAGEGCWLSGTADHCALQEPGKLQALQDYERRSLPLSVGLFQHHQLTKLDTTKDPSSFSGTVLAPSTDKVQHYANW